MSTLQLHREITELVSQSAHGKNAKIRCSVLRVLKMRHSNALNLELAKFILDSKLK